MSTSPETLIDRLWDRHVVRSFGEGLDLLYVDRHVLQEMTSYQAFKSLERAGRKVRRPELVMAVEDHIIATGRGRDEASYPPGEDYIVAQRRNVHLPRIRSFPIGDANQGIGHVVSPELGFALPGVTLVCADSHTCTVGGVGALGFGIGSSDAGLVLATQTLLVRRPRTMLVEVDGLAGLGVTAKDVILYTIALLGADAANGHGVEFAGSYVQQLEVEERLTICNMAVELGARVGIVAPDDTTFAYLETRRYVPRGKAWQQAVDHWRTLVSDAGAPFDRRARIDASAIAPQVSWGTSPQDTAAIDARVPHPESFGDPARRQAAARALQYMGLVPDQSLVGLPVQRVFIGSCTNSRLSDLRVAAAVAQRGHVAKGVRALVVPGSMAVKRAAELEGLHHVFQAAGFEWHEPGCSMCAGINADLLSPHERCAATSNRNFPGRQGPLGRTHLMSPPMAAAAALAGAIVDVRSFAA